MERLVCEKYEYDEIEEGSRNMEEGFEVVRSLGAAMEEPYLMGILGDGMSYAGRGEEALKYIEEALELADTKRGYFFESELLRLRGTLETDSRKAKTWYRKAIKSAEDQGNVSIMVRSLTTLGELGDEDAFKRVKAIVEALPEDYECPDADRAKELVANFKKR